MKNKFRKYLALLLTVLMLASCMPVDALAAIVPVSGGTQTSSGISLRSIVRPPVATATYIFMNGDTEFDRQILKHNETLKNPGTPAADSDKKEFVGWLADDGSAPAFGKVTVTETTKTTYRAQFEDVYFVFFTNDKGEVMVTKKGKAGDTISTEGITYPVGNEQSIVGWEDASGNLVSSVTLNGSDVTLKARVEDGHWITYDSQGGSYVAPAFVKGNGTTTAPAVPTRPGYTFHHWSETKDGAAFNFGNALTTALTLYAVWTKNDNTQYTVIHWQENADDDEYSYAEPEVKTGTTGAQTSAAAKSTAAGTKYNGFTAQTIAQQTIAGDGSTIVNVYYKRNEYSVKFYEYKSSGLFGGSWEENTRLRITAKHGANIRAKWPTGTFWYVSQNNQNTAQSNLDTMPIGGKNFYGKASGSGKAYYYVEVLPGESGTETVGGKTYRLDHTDTGYTSGTVTDEERYEMTGFTCNVQYSAKNGDNYSGSKFYYDRNSYNVVYINSGSQAKVTPYLYQQSIADAGNYELTDADAPAGKEGYVFAGWYDAPEGGNEFIFTGKTMPAQNVTVYAHWAEPTVNGKAHIKVDGTDEGTTLTATYGEALNAEELKTLQKAIMKDKTGYTWRGWRTGPNGTGEPFNVDTKIYSDITLYPYYTKDGTFTIVYDTVKTDVTVQADGKSYAEDSFADLKSPGKLVAADGEYFLGWSDGAATYQPRDKYQIKSNHADEQNVITLTAQWGARPGDATLINKSNDGTNREVSETCANNETITTKGENTFTRTGYTLTGWNTASDGSGDAFGLGEEVLLDNSGANVLYAVWTANTDVRYTVHYYKQDTTEKVAADKVVADQTFDDTVIERAVPVTGYTAVAPTEQKLKLDAYDKEISFYYTVNQYGYTIEYYIDGTKDDTRTVEDKADFGTVIDTYPNKCPEGYVFDKHENLPLTIGTDESANVIKVYYKKNVFTLTINYVYEDGSEAAETHTEDVEFDKTYSVTSPNVEGYTPDKAKVEGEMPASNVEVTVTYTKRSDLSYTVYYYWNGTTTPVANSKTVDKQTYNATVTENPATIGGYTAVSDETKTITIGTGENKIIFYYYKNVELTAISSDTITYDGNEHSVSGFTGAPEEADFTAITVGAKGTNAGTYPAEFAENTVGTVDGTEKYIITAANDGKLVINKAAVTVTITGVNETAVYDGRQHEANGYNYSFNGKPGQITISLKPNVLAIARRTDVGTTYMGLTKDSFTVTSANYDVTIKAVIDGYVTITPVTDKVTVTVTENGDIVTYDGNEHSVKGYKSMTADNTLYDVTKSVKATETAAWTAKGTEAGEYPVGVAAGDFENINKNFTNVAFVIVDGALKINPITDKVTVTITENSATYTYDGTEHSVKGYKSMTADNELYDVTTSVKATETAAWTAKGTNVGEYPVGIVAGDFVNTNTNFTNVEFVVVDGVLKITKATLKVTFTGESDTRVYNGSEQRLTGIEADGLLTGHKYEGLTYLASGTDAGEYTGKFTGTVKITDAAGVDVTENYIVEQEEGKLVINPITEKVTVTVTEKSATYTYDGTEHSVSGYKSMTADNTLYDVKTSVTETETAAWTAKGTNAGTYDVGIKAGDFKNTNKNFTNVEFVIVDGALKINPITDKVTVTVVENSETVTYDGKEHSVTGYESMTADNALYTIEGSVEETPTAAWTAKGTNVGEYPVGIVAGDFKNINGNFTNVEFVIVDGVLKITEANIKDYVTLNTVNVTEKYDGKPHATGTATAEDANNNELKIEYSADGETWTEDPSTITATDVADSKTVNVRVSSANYDGYVEGTQELKITKRKVTLTSATDSKPYDGTPLTNSNVTVGGEGFVEGEGASYDVTGTITNVGSVDNTFTYTLNENTNADNYGITKYEGKLTVTGDKIIPEKTTPNVESNYKLGDTILFTITVKNVSTEPVEKITVEDQMAIIVAGTGYTVSADGHTATIDSLASGAQVEISAKHVVTEDDILAGTVGNTATVTWDNTERNVTAKSDDIEDPKSELKVVKETTSEPKNGKTYALDEEIKYTITVTNTGNLTATDIEVTDSLSTNEGKVIGTIASLAPGESETFNFTYTVTEQDILNGKVLNEATAKGKTPDDKTPEGKDEQKDDTDDIDTTLEVIKTSNKQPGEKAKLGEKIEYTITVTNKGNVSYTNVKVDDELTGLHETIAKLGVGESKKFTTEWIVTEDDILNGKVLNVATAKGDDVPDPKDPENPKTPEGKDEKKDDTEGKNSALTVDKKTTSEPKNGKTYALGEEIKYTITVTNTGNLTATDIEVTDSLSTNEGKVIGTIASLAPDESKTFNFTYTVTEQDILNGKVLNVATAKGKTPDPDGKDPEGGGSTEDETDDIDTTLEVVKTSNKQPGEKAKLGEKIEYTITVTNKGNVSYTNVKVDDELTSLHETIAKLGVGDSKKFTTEWTVTEEDILNGKVLNVATAKGDKVPDPKDPENPKTPEGEGKKEDDTEEKQSSFNVEKTLTNLPEKGYFTLGETAEFNITVENTGNLTLTDLTVTEQLSGAKYAESNAYTVNGADAIIAELKPGEQVVIKASYTITEDDLGNKDLKNVVTGKGKGPDGKDPEGGDEEEVPTDDAVSVSGSKTWDDQDNRFEVRPETITLRLHADGAEYKTAEIGADQNWTYKFSKLPKHTKSGAEIVYTVTEDAVVGYETTTVETDSGVNFTNTLRQCTLHIDYTYIRHKGGTPHEAFPPVDMVLYYGQEYSVKSPKLWGFVPNIHKVEGVITEDTVVHVLYSGLDYTLTIEYVYEDGTTAAPTHTEVLKIYDRYGVASPKIPGYVPTWEFVAGSMYAHDEYYRIVYRAIKPQGVGNITLNLGDCFE